MNLFMDTEFTGLHKDASLISIAIISDAGPTFYAEFTDYGREQVSPWIRDNVINGLLMEKPGIYTEGEDTRICGSRGFIKTALLDWLRNQGTLLQFWLDCGSFDWVLFNDLLAEYDNEGYPHFPENVYYIPFDLATLLIMNNVDPDIDREEFAWRTPSERNKHNAMHDARTLQRCYHSLKRSVN